MSVFNKKPIVVKENINSELKKRIGVLTRVTKSSVLRATLLVKGESIKITPWLTGNLVGSAYTEITENKNNIVGEIGYTASYAPYVHEIKREHYTKEGTSWKFLETALKTNTEKVLNILINDLRKATR